jgi:hypothetical protein
LSTGAGAGPVGAASEPWQKWQTVGKGIARGLVSVIYTLWRKHCMHGTVYLEIRPPFGTIYE